MVNQEIDELIQEAKRIVRESESLILNLANSSEACQNSLDQFRINLEKLQKIKADIVATTLDS